MDQTASIDDLPPEMLSELFKHLNLKHLAVCSMVCKLWNQLISRHKVTRLVVVPRGLKKERWWHVSRPVDEYLEVCPLRMFATLLCRPILSSLKHLRINVYHGLAQLEPNDLNLFRQLIHLEVDYPIVRPNTEINWILPNLEILKVRLYEHDRISIDCPKLKVFSSDCRPGVSIDVKWPETISTLCAALYGSQLTKFKNIETYKCTAELQFVNDALIEQLPRLKMLEVCGDPQDLYFTLQTVDGVREFLKRLLSDRRKVLRSDLKLFFAGIEIVDEALVDRLDLQALDVGVGNSTRLSNEHLYFGDYPADQRPNLLDELEFVQKANYTRLMSLMNELPPDYFMRFYHVRCISTSGDIQRPEHFATFIKRLEFVEHLELLYPSLQQEWYDRLPSICSLRSITLYESEAIELSFDFLGRFEPFIEMLDVDRELSLNSASSLPNLIKSFKVWYVRKFRFKFRGANAMIRMRKSNEDSDQSDGSHVSYVELDGDYDVLVGRKLQLERANSTEVVNYFEQLEGELELV